LLYIVSFSPILWRFIHKLRKSDGITIVLTTHYLEEAESCDNVCFIDKGKIVLAGKPDILIKKFDSEILEIESSDIDELYPSLRAFLGEGRVDFKTAYFKVAKNKEIFVSQKIDQIKNISQEEKKNPEIQTEVKAEVKTQINSFDELLAICINKRELKLKFELEKNVNLVKFEKNRIEISFNDSLDKDFVKDLSTKLFEWTKERWIITLSKSKGDLSIREKKENEKKILIEKAKQTEIYKNFMENFPDAELVDVKSITKEDKDND
jgi:ABC-type proline/glycine betaine transport system ATPase subunit